MAQTQRAELSVMNPKSYIHAKRWLSIVMTSKQHGMCLLLRNFKSATGPVRYRYREVGGERRKEKRKYSVHIVKCVSSPARD